MPPSKISEVFEVLKKQNSSPITELNYRSDFTLLVAIVLSAQATDVSVNKATEKLFMVAATPKAILKLGEDGLKQYIKTIGLYNSKAKNIIRLCESLIERHNGKVPDNYEQLRELAGVGSKTANVFLNCYYKVPIIAVDTHVFRVANRLGLCKTKNADETEKKLNKIIPEKYRLYAHHWLILHGRYICTARKPKCRECVIREYCKSLCKSW
ncbi:MAG TPA: endonuclease III [Alphaproteobacteria bacterium]|nr:endonuclease III [Alphaproteobacteria bacterium]